jgi:anti-sigma regulatory factor (Ser/Thr protein kinase)
MVEPFSQSFHIEGRNFLNAGKASTEIKMTLKQLGVDAASIRRAAIAAYEAEMNVVMYARKGEMTFQVTPHVVRILVDDEGAGIPDVAAAMQEGYSTATKEMREMGFGAGMGLANIKKNSDNFTITSVVGKGTKLEITINLN